MDIATTAFMEKYFSGKELQKVFCPYRVCPMGAHIDHQYGKITGFAIDKGIEILYEPTEDGKIHLKSMNVPGEIEYNINDVPEEKQGDWGDYLRGATQALKRAHKLQSGIRAVIRGMLPIGGLSSSAAITVAYLTALCRANGITLPKHDMIMNALWAENEYVGVNCGKLDQSCVVYGKKDHLLYLDNLDDSFELIPRSPSMKPFIILIFFSGVERTLRGSAFNMRVDELKSASYALKAYAGMEYGKFVDSRLRDVPREIFERYADRLPDSWRRRATHYYTEMDRVEAGAAAWRAGDIEAYGKLSFESGYSSIHNYETGSDELRTLYEIMQTTDGIYGGRFSGAGFKGCCMALCDPAYEESILERVSREYLQKFPALEGKYSAHVCHTADGCTLE